jgi:hypothetical protein
MFNGASSFDQDLSCWDLSDNAFYEDDELRAEIGRYLNMGQPEWAESDCNGVDCGSYYGYVELLSCACRRGEHKELNGGSLFAFVPTIIAVLSWMTGMSVLLRASIQCFMIYLSSTNPLVTGMSPVVPTL